MPAVSGGALAAALPWSVRTNAACATEACISNWKITFSILLVVESLVFGHVVLLARAFSCVSPTKLLAVMRYGSAVAGGIFLSTGLLHIVPEAIALYEHAEEPHGAAAVNATAAAAAAAGVPGAPDAAGHGHGHGHEHIEFPAVFSIILASFYFMLVLEHVLIATCQRKTIEDEDNLSFDPDRSESLDLEVFGRSSMNLAATVGVRDEIGETNEGEGAGYLTRSFVACFVITIGVGAHSLLESVALGAATEFSDVLNLFIAIAAHRWATSAALGVRYAKANLASGPVVLLVFLFSFIAPIGVGFGFLAANANTMVQGVFFAMGAGTFLYLGATATLDQDAFKYSEPLRMYLSSAIGAGVILVITAILVRANVH